MKFFVGITDNQWFRYLACKPRDEVNFWRPGGGASFKAIPPNGLFLFKLHSPLNFIVGGGFFVTYSKLPLTIAWESFGENNGTSTFDEFQRVILAYRRKNGAAGDELIDPAIGCIILAEPFFWPEELWIPAPTNWPKSTVQGKTYDTSDSEGAGLWAMVQDRIRQSVAPSNLALSAAEARPSYGGRTTVETTQRYTDRLSKVRVGQGAFRVLVTDAYDRRCAITGEKTLPVLQAAHIQPFGKGGPHDVRNGLLLRSDMHTLFDLGYLTVTPEKKILVSKAIQQQFTNGKLYYSYHEQPLRMLPPDPERQPADEFLLWHNKVRFVA
ncbi:MAG: HNH endonuclease [Myxococcales bacterium]|jgi:putative restriction endonuclease|nr:HNH endonuclease [Myxococcales bacterium]